MELQSGPLFSSPRYSELGETAPFYFLKVNKLNEGALWKDTEDTSVIAVGHTVGCTAPSLLKLCS